MALAHPHDIRRLALQMLYQFDARGEEDIDAIKASLLEASDDPAGRYPGAWAVTSPNDPESHRRAFELAREAWLRRDVADRLASEAAPGWPTSRQPAMDRNVIRLCWHEMSGGVVPPKVAVNQAIELAKEFGTDRSAAFLNGVLDRLMRIALRSQESPDDDATAQVEAALRADEDQDETERSAGTTRPAPTTNDDAAALDTSHAVEHTEFWSSDH